MKFRLQGSKFNPECLRVMWPDSKPASHVVGGKKTAPLWLGHDFRALFLILVRRDLLGLVLGEQCLKLRLLGCGDWQLWGFNRLKTQFFSWVNRIDLVRRADDAGLGG